MKAWEEEDQIYKYPCLFFSKKHWSHWTVNCIIGVWKIHILPVLLGSLYVFCFPVEFLKYSENRKYQFISIFLRDRGIFACYLNIDIEA